MNRAMKSDKDLNATNQLIRVIRGEVYSIPQEGTAEKRESVAIRADHALWRTGWKIVILFLIFFMITFTFLSVSFLSGQVRNLEATRQKLASLKTQIKVPAEPIDLWSQKEKLAEQIDSIASFLSEPRPYASSLIKEISHILPKNCFLNRLHIFISSHEFSDKGTTLSIEATLVENAFLRGADLSKLVRSVDDSPLFAQPKIDYQDRSMLFNYRTIDFKLDFSLE